VGDVDWLKLAIRPPERSLAVLLTEPSIAKSEDLCEGNNGFRLLTIYFILVEFFYMP
jgi:hypothetical protein